MIEFLVFIATFISASLMLVLIVLNFALMFEYIAHKSTSKSKAREGNIEYGLGTYDDFRRIFKESEWEQSEYVKFCYYNNKDRENSKIYFNHLCFTMQYDKKLFVAKNYIHYLLVLHKLVQFRKKVNKKSKTNKFKWKDILKGD